jgi:UDP-4-amino-4,6-dideoxy-N-acetyl-beta-L-altrosamine transaminase
MLPYGKQWITSDDVAAVAEVLRSDYLTSGPVVEQFEKRFAEFVGARHAVAVNSATSALHLAMRVAGVGPGDRVVTSPNTFLASANCAAFVGATPDFYDVDPVTRNLDAQILDDQWLDDTKAVVAVAYAGQACDMPAIAAAAHKRNAIVVEDACHGIGGGFTHEGRPWKLGGHPWADMTVFSFHPVKTMTTGEGGILVTNSDSWAESAKRLRSHGVHRQLFHGLGAPNDPPLAEQGPWYYEMHDLGYNYRITDFQCALGLSQLGRLDAFTRRRRAIVARYNEAFADLGWLRTPGLRNSRDCEFIAWHLYAVEIDFKNVGKTRTQVVAELREKGIGTQVHYIPVHLQPWYRQVYGYGPGKCPVAEQYYRCTLSLPLYPGLSAEEIERVIDAVRNLN